MKPFMQRQPKRYANIPAGILIVNKPEGETSTQVVSNVKKSLNAKKVGHTGTLDPFATGIVICCINQATKLAQFFLEGDKTYEGVLHLGIDTDTQDKTGKIISQKEFSCQTSDIETVFSSFLGEIEQIPPIYSALKHKGVPLYRWAREGKPVQKPARKVSIYSLNIQDISLPFVRFDVRCSSGTYVRTLCADIGQKLGCGGHLKDLCRIESCGYSIKNALTYEQISAQVSTGTLLSSIVPIYDALKEMPRIVATSAIKRQIENGGPLFRSNFSQETLDQGDLLQLVTSDKKLLAVLRWTTESDECKVVRILTEKKRYVTN
ncbi:tRNA pseudouridine synthase B [Candidatus Magnetomorum sp. HK-1]|nr:tRNA pseudouridine synthase B [Candidatus Magnetomorum sp. HK-1]